MDLQSNLEMTEIIDVEEKVDIEDLVLPSKPTLISNQSLIVPHLSEPSHFLVRYYTKTSNIRYQ